MAEYPLMDIWPNSTGAGHPGVKGTGECKYARGMLLVCVGVVYYLSAEGHHGQYSVHYGSSSVMNAYYVVPMHMSTQSVTKELANCLQTFAYTQPLEISLQFLPTQLQKYSNIFTASFLKLPTLPVLHPFCPPTASTTSSPWYLLKALKAELNFTAMITNCAPYTTKSSCMHQNTLQPPPESPFFSDILPSHWSMS